jgi:hypothetical protein
VAAVAESGTSSRAPVGALAVAAAAALPFWTCPLVPTQDGPAHLYNAWLVLHLGDPALGLGRFFALDPLAPNWGGVGPLAALLAVAPPAIAEKLLFSAIAIVTVLGAAALAGRLGGDAVLGSAVGAVLAHGWMTAMGFTGFQLALGLGWLACAWAARALDRDVGSRSVAFVSFRLSLAFGLLLFLHLAAAVCAAGLWAAMLLAVAFRGRWRRAVVLAAPLAVLLALWGAHGVLSRANEAPPYRADPRGALGRLAELGAGTWLESYGPSDRPLGAALVVLVIGLAGLRGARRGRPAATDGATALALAVPFVLVAYLFVPFAAGGGAYLTDRLVPLLLLLPLPWATSAGLPWRRALRSAAVVLAVAVLAQRAAQYRAAGRAVESVLALNRHVPRGALLVQPPSPGLALASVDPLLHTWGRVAVEAGAVPLDDYEAALGGWFPVRYTAEGQAAALAWTRGGVAPPGAAVVRFR